MISYVNIGAGGLSNKLFIVAGGFCMSSSDLVAISTRRRVLLTILQWKIAIT